MTEQNYTVTKREPAPIMRCEPTNITDAIWFAQIQANADRKEANVVAVDSNGWYCGIKYVIRPERSA